MEKSVFQRYLDKYNLGGACESVTFVSKNDNVLTRSVSDDKSVLCEVEATSLGVPSGEYAVYETARLKSIINVLDERISVSVNGDSDRPTSVEFSDSNNTATFVLSDPAIIPAVPELKSLPKFNITIDLDESLISTFVKAKAALPEVETFTVLSEGNEIFIVLGYSSLNTNRIKMNTGITTDTQFHPISFSASYFKDILLANKDCKSGTLQVSVAGLALAKFSVNNMNSTYYLVRIDTVD